MRWLRWEMGEGYPPSYFLAPKNCGHAWFIYLLLCCVVNADLFDYPTLRYG